MYQRTRPPFRLRYLLVVLLAAGQAMLVRAGDLPDGCEMDGDRLTSCARFTGDTLVFDRLGIRTVDASAFTGLRLQHLCVQYTHADVRSRCAQRRGSRTRPRTHPRDFVPALSTFIEPAMDAWPVEALGGLTLLSLWVIGPFEHVRWGNFEQSLTMRVGVGWHRTFKEAKVTAVRVAGATEMSHLTTLYVCVSS